MNSRAPLAVILQERGVEGMSVEWVGNIESPSFQEGGWQQW